MHQSVCVVIASTWNHNQLLRCFPVFAATGKARLEQLTEALRSPALEGPAMHMHPVEFEKVSRRILFCTHRTFQTPQRHSDDRTSGDRRSRSAVPGPFFPFLWVFGFLCDPNLCLALQPISVNKACLSVFCALSVSTSNIRRDFFSFLKCASFLGGK